MSTPSAGLNESLRQQLVTQQPFALLDQIGLNTLFNSALMRRAAIGSRLLRPDELPAEVLLVLKGEVRLLVKNGNDEITLCKRGPGQLIGWSSLVRAEPCEWVQASTDVELVSFSARLWIQLIREQPDFASYFYKLPGLQEAHAVALAAAELHPRLSKNWDIDLIDRCMSSRVFSVLPGHVFVPPVIEKAEFDWFLSTGSVPLHPVGESISPGTNSPKEPVFLCPIVLLDCAEINLSLLTSKCFLHI